MTAPSTKAEASQMTCSRRLTVPNTIGISRRFSRYRYESVTAELVLSAQERLIADQVTSATLAATTIGLVCTNDAVDRRLSVAALASHDPKSSRPAIFMK